MFGSKKIQTGSKWKSKPGLNIKIDYDVNVWSQKKIKMGLNGHDSEKRSNFNLKRSLIFMFGFKIKVFQKIHMYQSEENPSIVTGLLT